MKSKTRTYKKPGSRSKKIRSNKPRRKVGSRSKKTSKRTPSKGWKKSAPKKGTQRKILMEKCGSRCFLEPKKFGYPVCKAYEKGKKSNCKINCEGVLSAYVRSKQWKKPQIARKALSLAKKYGCKSLRKSL